MKAVITLLVCLLVNIACAQQPDTALAKATYNFVHVRDTNNRDKPYKETMTLLLGRSVSLYRSLDKQLQQEAMAAQIKSQMNNAQNPNSIDLTITSSGAITSDEYYQYANEKKLYIETNIVNYYLVEDPLPAIDWKIQKDTMSFGALHCQKANARVKGRNYEAWFCPELPFRNGPWKLWGLPGLILEAYDTKKEVMFKFAGFEDIRKQHLLIGPPADDIKTTTEKIERLKETRLIDPASFNKATQGITQARRGSAIDDMIDPSHIHSININKSEGGNIRVVNNPLEVGQ